MSLRRELTAGVLAGIAGGILIQGAFFVSAMAKGQTIARYAQSFAFVAAALLGANALQNPSAVPIGIAIHFAVSIGWALGYVYLLRSQPQLLARPLVSGAGFGLVVYVFMQIVLLTAGEYHRPSGPDALATQLIAHIFFYGMPVALIASRVAGRAR